jgi:hypothetical protein
MNIAHGAIVPLVMADYREIGAASRINRSVSGEAGMSDDRSCGKREAPYGPN